MEKTAESVWMEVERVAGGLTNRKAWKSRYTYQRKPAFLQGQLAVTRRPSPAAGNGSTSTAGPHPIAAGGEIRSGYHKDKGKCPNDPRDVMQLREFMVARVAES